MEKLLWFSSKKFDLPLFLASAGLIVLGLSTIQSTVIASSSENGILTSSLINVQILSISIGAILFLVALLLNYRYLVFASLPLYAIAVASLVLVLLIGVNTRGATRWFSLGIVNFQPSTVTALILILSLATYFHWVKERINNWIYFALSFVIVAVPMGLILMEPDLGVALVLGAIWFAMLHLTPIKFSRLATLYIVIMVLTPLVWTNLAEYQQSRVLSFLNPVADPLGSGYNSLQSVIAVGSGQVLGRGWGQGTQSHLNFLPEQHTDFIFATFAEEQGFVGSLVVLVLYGIFVWRSYVILSRADDLFAQLLVGGVIVWFSVHVLINVAMNIGLAPITGIPLPFMSYGGTAMITTLIALGLIQSVAVHQTE